jgi:hypothetical protein
LISDISLLLDCTLKKKNRDLQTKASQFIIASRDCERGKVQGSEGKRRLGGGREKGANRKTDMEGVDILLIFLYLRSEEPITMLCVLHDDPKTRRHE